LANLGKFGKNIICVPKNVLLENLLLSPKRAQIPTVEIFVFYFSSAVLQAKTRVLGQVQLTLKKRQKI